jgi:hypothetical protein
MKKDIATLKLKSISIINVFIRKDKLLYTNQTLDVTMSVLLQEFLNVTVDIRRL